MPFFSIIVCAYNTAEYTKKCLQSIQEQTFIDFECIIVDDGSIDNTQQICKEFAEIDSRFIYSYKENGGLVSARKYGAERVKGQYVLNIDGDDWVDHEYLSTFKTIIDEYDVDICRVGFSMEYLDESVPVYGVHRAGFYSKEQLVQELYPAALEARDGHYVKPSIWSEAIRRELYVPMQLAVDSGLVFSEDKSVFISCLFNAESFYYEDKPLYRYRQRMSSICFRRDVSYPWVTVEILKNTFEPYIPMCPDGERQLARFLTHTMFILAEYNFNKNMTFWNVRKEIIKEINANNRKSIIKKANYVFRYWKGNISKISMTLNVVSVAYLYNRFNRKRVIDNEKYYS